jgi:hypothetical protein
MGSFAMRLSLLPLFLLIGCFFGLVLWSQIHGWQHGLSVVMIANVLAWSAWLWLRYDRLPSRWQEWLLLGLPLLALFAPPLLDDDAWRFLWDGWITTQGWNPYHRLPADFLGQQELPTTIAQVLDTTAYPDAPTVYGPGLQLLFALAAWIALGELWAWKLILWLAHIALWVALKHDATPTQKNQAWLALMVPPVFFEFALNAHPDVIAIALMTWALRCSASRPVLAGVLMAWCLASRVQGYVLLPFFLWCWPWRGRLSWAASMIMIYSPLWWLGSNTEWFGISHFGAMWEFNSSLVALLGSDALARTIGLGVAALLCGGAFLHWVRAGAVLERCPALFCFSSVFIGSAVFNPWYALWMLPFLALQAGSTWRYAWLALPSLSYVTLGNLGLDLTHAFAHPVWLRPLEFALLVIASYLASRGRVDSQSASTSTSRQAGISSQTT